MKKIVTILVCLAALAAWAEPQTLFGGPNAQNGWYVAPVAKMCTSDPSLWFLGVQGGWIINHKITIGMAGFGMTQEPLVPNHDNLRYSFGYGGLLLEYEPHPDNLVHLDVQALIGPGVFTFINKSAWEWDEDEWDTDSVEEYDYFFVAEPAVNVILNLTHRVRCGAGVAYRYVNGVEKYGFTDADAEGVKLQFFVKFGSF